MFATISEAWNKDPVKEITEKLNDGMFKSTFPQEIYDLDKTENSLSIVTENLQSTPTFNFTKNNSKKKFIGKKNSNKNSHKKKNNKKKNYQYKEESEITDSDNWGSEKYSIKKEIDDIISECESESCHNTKKCNYTSKHLRKCDKCYNELKNIINKKISKKIDTIILDSKMKQLNNISNTSITSIPTTPNIIPSQISVNNSLFRQTVIIIACLIIVIAIIFIVVKLSR